MPDNAEHNWVEEEQEAVENMTSLKSIEENNFSLYKGTCQQKLE